MDRINLLCMGPWSRGKATGHRSYIVIHALHVHEFALATGRQPGGFSEMFPKFSRNVFPKKLGLDEGITLWELKNRIPREKLPIWSYSQV